MTTEFAIEVFETMLEQDFLACHERDAIRLAIDIMGQLGKKPDKHRNIEDDPFTALVEADKWYKENVEVLP